jgi:hypothetical protein
MSVCRAISVPWSQVIERSSDLREVAHAGGQRGVHRQGVPPRQVQQPDHPGLPLDQRADHRALVLADDQSDMTGLTWPLQPTGPAQFDYLVHFCGRPASTTSTPSVPMNIRTQSPLERLANILWQQRLYGFPPFRAAYNQPMVCLNAHRTT